MNTHDPTSPAGRTDAPPMFEDMAAANDAARKKQRLWLYSGVAVAGVIVAAIVLGHGNKPAASVAGQVPGRSSTNMPINTDSMTAASLADSNYRAMSENRMDSMENQLKGNQARDAKIQQLEQQLSEIHNHSPNLPSGSGPTGQNLAKNEEMTALRAQIAELKRGNNLGSIHGLSTANTPGYPGVGQTPIGAGPSRPSFSSATAPLVKIDSYVAGAGGKVAERSNLIFADSPDYLPPNSMATARVIVGADAQTSVRSQSEPIPVILRLTSNARSVAQDGKLLQTQIQGCLVNGAAYGDLSSEKVFVKLQKMTCNGAHGGVTVSEVKGFIAFAAKAGVRGNVVSREGSFVLKAFLAGLVGGVGKLGQNVAQSQLYNSYSTNGALPKMDLSTIAGGAGGSGVSQAAGDMEKYMIERAEQYQPVVEMPTGIDVEVVFLDGSYVR